MHVHVHVLLAWYRYMYMYSHVSYLHMYVRYITCIQASWGIVTYCLLVEVNTAKTTLVAERLRV